MSAQNRFHRLVVRFYELPITLQNKTFQLARRYLVFYVFSSNKFSPARVNIFTLSLFSKGANYVSQKVIKEFQGNIFPLVNLSANIAVRVADE
jgi:hypothetical protein